MPCTQSIMDMEKKDAKQKEYSMIKNMYRHYAIA